MGLHADIRKDLQKVCGKSFVKPADFDSEFRPCPEVCVVDIMWLLYRVVPGSGGRDLVDFVTSQAESAFRAGSEWAILLTDNERAVPEFKAEEQRRRTLQHNKRRRANDDENSSIDFPPPILTENSGPGNWASALANRGFKYAALSYLRDHARAPEIPSSRLGLAANGRRQKLLLRYGDGDVIVFVRCEKTGEWRRRDDATIFHDLNGRYGEADVACVRAVQLVAKDRSSSEATPISSLVIRTIDSDSIPIMLMLQERLPEVVMFLWMPTCGKVNDEMVCESLPTTTHDRMVSAAEGVPHFDRLWCYEKKRVLCVTRLRRMIGSMDDVRKFCLSCIIMGTDFNEKLVRNAGYEAIKNAISSTAIPSVEDFVTPKHLRAYCQNVVRKTVTKNSKHRVCASESLDDYVRAKWVLRYWSCDFEVLPSSRADEDTR